jgi:CheY-like chemotaxis protein
LLDAAGQADSVAEPPQDSRHESRVFTVVYADDEADVRDAMASALRSHGFVVYACAHGGEAVATCFTVRPDAVLLDLDMPVVDGFSAAYRIRKLGCAKRIVALTREATTGMRAAALQAGFDQFLSKPVSVDTLVETLIAADPASPDDH